MTDELIEVKRQRDQYRYERDKARAEAERLFRLLEEHHLTTLALYEYTMGGEAVERDNITDAIDAFLKEGAQ
jgi:uncharacterized membrane protein YccC